MRVMSEKETYILLAPAWIIYLRLSLALQILFCQVFLLEWILFIHISQMFVMYSLSVECYAIFIVHLFIFVLHQDA